MLDGGAAQEAACIGRSVNEPLVTIGGEGGIGPVGTGGPGMEPGAGIGKLEPVGAYIVSDLGKVPPPGIGAWLISGMKIGWHGMSLAGMGDIGCANGGVFGLGGGGIGVIGGGGGPG